MSKNNKVKSLLMQLFPDNRPITSLQIVEDYVNCPTNFFPITRTYDQDTDADLWRETTILFGKRTPRYLCLSKSEGLQDYIIETLTVISTSDPPPEGFSLLSRTADSEQKAWRKRQITYKLTKRGAVTQAVTDIILCLKSKMAPEGFLLAGDINGIAVCYKLGAIAHRAPPQIPPPPIPSKNQSNHHLEQSLNYLNISAKPPFPLPSEQMRNHNFVSSPPPPQPPPLITNRQNSYTSGMGGTLSGAHTDIEGIPFVLNANLTQHIFEVPPIQLKSAIEQLDYDFHLERQILCTTKSNNSKSKNPFFN